MGCIRVTRLLALAVAVSLTLGAAAQDAEAKSKRMCKDREPRKGCVDSKDVENGSIDASEHLKHEARGKFDGSGVLSTVGILSKIFGKVNFKLPKDGVMIAAAYVDFNDVLLTKFSMSCSIMADQDGLSFPSKRFVGSVNSEKDVSFTSMYATTSFKVKKGNLRVRLSCRVLGEDIDVGISPSLSAQYFPTED